MNETSRIIQETLIRVSELKAPLVMVSTESEPQFVNLGNNLQDIFSGAEDLTDLTRETARMIDGESSDNILSNIGAFSRTSLSKLNTSKDDISIILPKVETCSINLKRLYDMSPVIRTIAKKLNIVALHISMESSRSKECEEMFNFFVGEIKQLAAKVHEISVKIRDDSEKAKTNQIADFSTIADRKEILNSLADNAHRSVEDNVHHMEGLIKLALKTMRNAEIHSKKISSLVGEVVVAIQFHDIVRQQIEHVVENLEEVRSFFIEDTNSESNSNENQTASLAKTYSILRLQVEQINQVATEIHDAHNRIQRSFHEIGNEVDNLVNGMSDLSLDTEGTQYTGNPFEQLISGLNQLDKIISQGREMTGMIGHNLRQSAESAENLAAHLSEMEDISMDLHIKAINALIMSKRLGANGKTLSVLAEDVTEVSTESNDFVLDVVEILKAIGDLTADLKDLSREEENYPGDGRDNLSGSVNVISALYDDFMRKSSQSVEQSSLLREKIFHLESELEFFRRMEDTLSSQQKNINKIIENITPYIPDDNIGGSDLEHLSERYTMEIERGIHNKALKKHSASSESPRDANSNKMNTPENIEEDYLGDNIDLF